MSFTGNVLVDFFSESCAPCKKLSTDLDDLKDEFRKNYNLSILKLNINDNYELAEKYSIMALPTVILFQNNEAKKTFKGYLGKEHLKKFVQENL